MAVLFFFGGKNNDKGRLDESHEVSSTCEIGPIDRAQAVVLDLTSLVSVGVRATRRVRTVQLACKVWRRDVNGGE